MNQEEMKDSTPRLYLEHPTHQLLDEYGDGGHIPGSGSAAALAGLLGLQLTKTVCKITLRKQELSQYFPEMRFILEKIDSEYRPLLTKLFNEDIQIFDQVSKLRVKRDEVRGKNEQLFRKYGAEETENLKIATDIPIQVCESCIKAVEFAQLAFDHGWHAVRGDSGVAISNLLSAISGSIFVVLLNIKMLNSRLKNNEWVKERQVKANELISKHIQLQEESLKRVSALYSQGIENDESQMNLFGQDEEEPST